jgi:pimeloyl-ACP methyl ester carboxylesterase
MYSITPLLSAKLGHLFRDARKNGCPPHLLRTGAALCPCFTLAVLVPILLVLTAAPRSAFAASKNVAPCTTATLACTEWVELGGGPARSMVYRTYSLSVPNKNIRRALIMVHGTLRNADHYFRTATTAAFLDGALNDTVVIAPSIRSADRGCDDKLEPNEVSWSCRGDSWRSGGVSLSNKNLTSFDFVDELLRRLADKKIFPNLTTIVIAGHSVGGQFVDRYEMANRVGDHLGVKVLYVVANPSSYAWPVSTRPLPVDDGAPANAVLGWKSEEPHTNFSYGAFDDPKAPHYDLWPYGLKDRTSGYTASMSDDQLRQQLISRPATYLLSQVDTLPLGGFDGSPNAMAQGATRRARGEAFVKYINEDMGAHAKILVVPRVWPQRSLRLHHGHRVAGHLS